MAAHGMLPNIREHSFRVMQVADRLGRALAAAGFELHLPLISTGALLHDMGKTACLGTPTTTPIWAPTSWPPGLSGVGPGGAGARAPGGASDPRPLREAEVVNYADKRVLHNRVVTLAERFADLRSATAGPRRPGPHRRHGGQDPDPGGKIVCTLAPDSSGPAPGQWTSNVQGDSRQILRTTFNVSWSFAEADC